MALVKAVLTAVNDNVALPIVNERNGAASFQVPSTAVGTYTMEATLNGVDWIALLLTNSNTGATSATAAAPGIYYANTIGYFQVRIKKTVGVAAETISFAVNDF